MTTVSTLESRSVSGERGNNQRSRVGRVVLRILRSLPEGRSLPPDVWQPRHRGILALLWIQAVGLVAFALIAGNTLAHSLTEGAVVAAMALGATPRKLGRT